MINLEWSFLFPLAFLSSKDNLLKEKMPYLFSMAKVINILLSPQKNINKEPRQRLLCFQFLILPLLLRAHTCFTQLSEREGGGGKKERERERGKIMSVAIAMSGVPNVEIH